MRRLRMHWEEWAIVVAVVLWGALIAMWLTEAQGAPVAPAVPTVDRSRVPLSYWLAECSGWPLSAAQLADDGIRVQSVHTKPGRVSVRLRHAQTGRRVHLVAHRLGSREQGWSVWSVRGPSRIAVLMASSDKCRVVATYQQALAWPEAARNWLSERSTCYGSATWRGRAYTVWPCRWSTERAGEGSVTRLDGIGPGVLSGGSGAAAAGVDQGGPP